MWVNNINPVLVNLGPLQIRWYGLVYLFGALLAYWMVDRARKKGKLALDSKDVSDLVLWLLVGVLVGSRVFFFAFYRPDLFSFLNFLAVWNGGLSFHGGFVGIVTAAYLFSKRKKIDFWHVADILAAPMMLALAFGRIANFINGELWGTVSNARWCIVFPDGGSQCRHPYQLYEGVKRFVLFGWLVWLGTKSHFNKGFIFWNLVFFEGLGRFLLDFVKDEFTVLFLTSGQWMSLVMMIVALYFFWKNHREDLRNLLS